MSNDMPFIVLKNVSRKYKQGTNEIYALKDISISIKRGEFVTIVGKSGSGKSTLLNVLAKIDHITDGEIMVNGIDIGRISPGDAACWRGRNIGIVFQFFQLIPTLTVLENILLPMDLIKSIPLFKRKKRALELLDRIGLIGHNNQFPFELSGGEQQRCAIARALANDVPILFADEPTGNLDSASAEQIIKLFGQLKQEKKTVVMVTHERDRIPHSDRTIGLLDGSVAEDIRYQENA
jgi:putative ABC transport system ATP-binding protein